MQPMSPADSDLRPLRAAHLKPRRQRPHFLNSLKWNEMSLKSARDIEKTYSNADFVAKLRRLADSIESNDRFEIQIASERIYVPVRAAFSVEHEVSDTEEVIEFQVRWHRT